MDKRKKIVCSTVVIGMSMIGGFFAYRTINLNKDKEKMLTDLKTSNISLTLDTSETLLSDKLINLDVEVADGPIKLKFEDYLIDGNNILIGVSEIQNIKPSNFQVKNKDAYKAFLGILEEEYTNDKENYTKLGEALMRAQLDVFSGKDVTAETYNISGENKDIINLEIERMKECYRWGLSNEDFKNTFKDSSGNKISLMENFALPNIKISINNEDVPLEIISTPVSISGDYIHTLGYGHELKEDDNYLIMEFTLGIKVPEKFKNTKDLDISISFENYTISPYYPVTIGKNLNTSFKIATDKIKFDNNNLEINETFKSESSYVKLLSYSESDYISEVTFEIPIDGSYDIAIFDSENNIIKPIFLTDNPAKKTNIITFKYNKFASEKIPITIFPDEAEKQSYILDLTKLRK